MKKNIFFLLVLTVIPIFFSASILAQKDADKEEKIPPGMQVIEIRSTKFLIPKGAHFKRKGDLIIVETAAEYTARRLSEMEERLIQMEAKLKEMREKTEQLDKALREIQKDNPAPDTKGK